MGRRRYGVTIWASEGLPQVPQAEQEVEKERFPAGFPLCAAFPVPNDDQRPCNALSASLLAGHCVLHDNHRLGLAVCASLLLSQTDLQQMQRSLCMLNAAVLRISKPILDCCCESRLPSETLAQLQRLPKAGSDSMA